MSSAKASSKAVKAAPTPARGGLQRWFGVKSTPEETPAGVQAPAAPPAAPAPPVAESGIGLECGASCATAAASLPSPGSSTPAAAAPAALGLTSDAAAAPAGSLAGSPAASLAGSPAAHTPQALSSEQQRRIEENRRRAAELRQSKQAQAVTQPAVQPTAATGPAAAAELAGVSPATGRARGPVESTPEKPAAQLPAKRPLVPPTDAKRGTNGVAQDLNSRGPWVQYHGLYAARLRQLKAAVLEQARALWSGLVAPEGFMHDITGYRSGVADAEVVLVGIVFKEMKSRPNLIEEYREGKGIGLLSQSGIVGQEAPLWSDDDALWLEDTVMRVKLVVGPDDLARIATGLVVGVRGAATNHGDFKVSGLCLARMPPTAALIPGPPSSVGPFLALLSGFGVDVSSSALVAARNRAVSFLTGAGEDDRTANLGKAVRHVVVCGGALAISGVASTAALEETDDLLARLAAVVTVHVMPGAGDPTTASLPQLPLHPGLFRRARGCDGFRCAGNPHSFGADGLAVTGHSGQPVVDLLRCTRLSSPLEALAMSLEALHLAPTAPDTLPVHPFTEEDPFVLSTPPHVLFSGGHERPEHEWRASAQGGPGTLCVCVPAFHKRPAVVLVNMHDPRDVRIQEFGAEEGLDAQMACAE